MLQNGKLISGKQAANEFANYYAPTGYILITKETDSKTKTKIKEKQKKASAWVSHARPDITPRATPKYSHTTKWKIPRPEWH